MKTINTKYKNKKTKKYISNKMSYQFDLMMLPSVILLLVFSYGGMFGIVMAFQKYIPTKGFFGSKWVGLKNFKYLFEMPDFIRVFKNTLTIASLKIIGGLIITLVVALLLNEIRNTKFKKIFQTVVYLPYFLSWVVLGGIFMDILAPSGVINSILQDFGMTKIYFLGDNRYFQGSIVWLDIWKNFGYGTIIYLAAMTGIDPNLYEAAEIDGAGRIRQTWSVTLPSILSIVILITTLNLGNVLNAGFDQILNLYTPQVYKTGDIIDTIVYRMGLIDQQYSVATAVGLFKSAISFFLIIFSYKLADKFGGYKIF